LRVCAAAAARIWAAPVTATEDGVKCYGGSDVDGGLDCVFCSVPDRAVGFVAIAVGF
jgi:hypothetical protein